MTNNNNTKLFAGLHHANIRALDFEKTKKFYTDGLGLPCIYEWGEPGKMRCFIEIAPGQHIEIFTNLSGEALPEGTVNHFALRTSNLEAAIEKAVNSGATIEIEPRSNTFTSTAGEVDLKIAFVRTPNGELIEFVESPQDFF